MPDTNGPPDGDDESPLDGLRTLAPAEIRNLLPTPVLIPVDSNMLLKNIARDVREAPKRTHIRVLAELGVLRLFAGYHVYDEMNEHLSEFMVGQGLDPSVAESIWLKDFLPCVRFVDTTQFPLTDPRVLAVRDRDADDAPTAILACLLGSNALSEDQDLVD
jgi:predicted nucleic acid-binding protein